MLLKLPLNTDKVNPLFINRLILSNKLSVAEYRVDDAKIQLDTINVCIQSLKHKILKSILTQTDPNGKIRSFSDKDINATIEFFLNDSVEYNALIADHFKISKFLALRQKKCSIISNELDLYEHLIKDFFLDKTLLIPQSNIKEI